ncbi:hypothetical protein A5789_34650 [Nocardia sp. 852002-51101_SCH5132738]|nr:hypothetical protein A5789_34650 [Nocardia sp. 852002-51101_SCH5132738]OBB30250.1 hypothetical protein A5748_08925 [Nocardia sp. 852002-51244_SCH5132740]OBF68007.1 hypothetical protein A9X06_35120 [Mycobacterium sp. 852002-51759_SCH5129042]
MSLWVSMPRSTVSFNKIYLGHSVAAGHSGGGQTALLTTPAYFKRRPERTWQRNIDSGRP